eukprot:27205_1
MMRQSKITKYLSPGKKLPRGKKLSKVDSRQYHWYDGKQFAKEQSYDKIVQNMTESWNKDAQATIIEFGKNNCLHIDSNITQMILSFCKRTEAYYFSVSQNNETELNNPKLPPHLHAIAKFGDVIDYGYDINNYHNIFAVDIDNETLIEISNGVRACIPLSITKHLADDPLLFYRFYAPWSGIPKQQHISLPFKHWLVQKWLKISYHNLSSNDLNLYCNWKYGINQQSTPWNDNQQQIPWDEIENFSIIVNTENVDKIVWFDKIDSLFSMNYVRRKYDSLVKSQKLNIQSDEFYYVMTDCHNNDDDYSDRKPIPLSMKYEKPVLWERDNRAPGCGIGGITGHKGPKCELEQMKSWLQKYDYYQTVCHELVIKDGKQLKHGRINDEFMSIIGSSAIQFIPGAGEYKKGISYCVLHHKVNDITLWLNKNVYSQFMFIPPFITYAEHAAKLKDFFSKPNTVLGKRKRTFENFENKEPRKKKQKVNGKRGRKCDVCNVWVPSSEKCWLQHIKGKRHQMMIS